MRYLKTFIVCAVVALAIIFMVQNIEPLSHPLGIRLNLFFIKLRTTPYPTYLVILLAFFVGLLAASLLGLAERFRMRRQLKAKTKEVEDLTKELSSLRNLPLTSDPVPASSQLPEPDKEEEPAEA